MTRSLCLDTSVLLGQLATAATPNNERLPVEMSMQTFANSAVNDAGNAIQTAWNQIGCLFYPSSKLLARFL